MGISFSQPQIDNFRSLFKGREDIYAVRWEKDGRSGYMPAYQFDWNEFMAHKAKGGTIRNFENKTLLPLSDGIIQNHLQGQKTIGIYPLLQNNHSYFVAADFDGENWAEESLRYLGICEQNDIPVYLERSRSGNGGHVWIFFEESYPAVKSRQIAFEMIRKVFGISEFQKDVSFDRLFPNQDYLSKEGFGNLIALPLNGKSSEQDNSVFIDPDSFVPYVDQFAFLSTIKKVSTKKLDELYDSLVRKSAPLSKSSEMKSSLSGKLEIQLRNSLVLAKDSIPSEVAAFIKERLNFPNPDYLLKKRLGKSTYKTEKFFNLIGDCEGEISLPRGFLSQLTDFLDEKGIEYRLIDERKILDPVDFKTNIALYGYQERAISVTENQENGVFVSPPGSGKTIMALKIIEQKKQNALIIVHRKELLDQWKDRIMASFGYSKKEIGQIGGGKNVLDKPIVIGMIQAISRMKNIERIVENFGTIIVDECHHIPAKTFRETISKFTPKHLYGFTATPKRKNHDESLIYSYIGDIIAEIDSEEIRSESGVIQEESNKSSIIIRETSIFVPFNYKIDKYETLSKILVFDTARNKLIIDDVLSEVGKKRKILILTERKEQVSVLYLYLKNTLEAITLTGDDGIKDRKRKMDQIRSGDFQVVIATGQFLGEGIDLHVFESLFLIYPFSFEGKLIQYMGRVNRSGNFHTVYDYHDRNVEYLEKLFKKRQTHYNKLVKSERYSLTFI